MNYKVDASKILPFVYAEWCKVAHSPHKARAVVQFYSLAIQEKYINWKGDTNMDIIQEINQNGLTKEQYEKCLKTIIDKKTELKILIGKK